MKYYRSLLEGPTLAGTAGADILQGSPGGTVFEYDPDGKWINTWAQNAGDPGRLGTLEKFSINQYLRSNDIFIGAAGVHNKLVMNDGKLALFLDDPYSANGNMARLQNIQEIVAGDGGQVIDLTSDRFAFGNVTILGGADADVLMSSAGNDSMNGLAGNDYLWGGSGNDAMAGGFGNDRVLGGHGNDTVRGGQDNDQVSGGLGNDSVYGDTGNDSISGNENDDRLMGGDGNDTVNGDDGNDRLSGGKGVDVLNGGTGNDTAAGNSGNDQLNGLAGSDVLSGDWGNDTLSGGDDADRLSGGSGNDVLLGGNGNDTIMGNFGNDTMTGNAGADRFVWKSNDNFAWGLNPNDAEAGTPFVDRITDFGTGDILDLSELIKNGTNMDATDFVKFKAVSGGTMVSAAKFDGAAFHDVVFLAGVTVTNVEAAQDAGWLII